MVTARQSKLQRRACGAVRSRPGSLAGFWRGRKEPLAAARRELVAEPCKRCCFRAASALAAPAKGSDAPLATPPGSRSAKLGRGCRAHCFRWAGRAKELVKAPASRQHRELPCVVVAPPAGPRHLGTAAWPHASARYMQHAARWLGESAAARAEPAAGGGNRWPAAQRESLLDHEPRPSLAGGARPGLDPRGGWPRVRLPGPWLARGAHWESAGHGRPLRRVANTSVGLGSAEFARNAEQGASGERARRRPSARGSPKARPPGCLGARAGALKLRTGLGGGASGLSWGREHAAVSPAQQKRHSAQSLSGLGGPAKRLGLRGSAFWRRARTHDGRSGGAQPVLRGAGQAAAWARFSWAAGGLKPSARSPAVSPRDVPLRARAATARPRPPRATEWAPYARMAKDGRGPRARPAGRARGALPQIWIGVARPALPWHGGRSGLAKPRPSPRRHSAAANLEARPSAPASSEHCNELRDPPRRGPPFALPMQRGSGDPPLQDSAGGPNPGRTEQAGGPRRPPGPFPAMPWPGAPPQPMVPTGYFGQGAAPAAAPPRPPAPFAHGSDPGLRQMQAGAAAGGHPYQYAWHPHPGWPYMSHPVVYGVGALQPGLAAQATPFGTGPCAPQVDTARRVQPHSQWPTRYGQGIGEYAEGAGRGAGPGLPGRAFDSPGVAQGSVTLGAAPHVSTGMPPPATGECRSLPVWHRAAAPDSLRAPGDAWASLSGRPPVSAPRGFHWSTSGGPAAALSGGPPTPQARAGRVPGPPPQQLDSQALDSWSPAGPSRARAASAVPEIPAAEGTEGAGLARPTTSPASLAATPPADVAADSGDSQAPQRRPSQGEESPSPATPPTCEQCGRTFSRPAHLRR